MHKDVCPPFFYWNNWNWNADWYYLLPTRPTFVPLVFILLNETVTNCNALKMRAADGKMRMTDVADTEQRNLEIVRCITFYVLF